jgi:hypothetical protein
MTSFDSLLACAGTWEGDNRVQVEIGAPIEASPSRLVVTPVLRDTFVHFDHTWSWKDEPQIGAMLVGYDPKSAEASIHWIDTWHNGRRVMPLVGRFEPHGALVAHGHFPVANSPDWGWRIEIRLDGDRLKIDMFCLDPGGTKEEGYVWMSFARA